MDSNTKNLFHIPSTWKKLRRNNEACLKNTMYTYIYINFVSKKNEDFLLINEEIINRFDGCRTIIGIISEEKRQALMAVSNATERAVSSPVRDSLRARNACAWIMRAHAHASGRENARADTPWLMERRARRKARGHAMRSTLLLAPCACLRVRTLSSNYLWLPLNRIGTCWLLTLRENGTVSLNIVLIAMDG